MVLSTVLRRRGVFRKGQLKLSVYMNCGLLTVHVIEARHLSPKWKSPADSFVQVSLVPDQTNHSPCRTDIVLDSNNPTYDDKFSFELTAGDFSKRLMLTVYHKDPVSGLKEFLGCTSFGLRHLENPSKDINGWYHLLTEDIGCKKHLHVKNKKDNSVKTQDVHVPAINADIRCVEELDIIVHRGKSGFGFTVVDSCPVKIGQVDRASKAEAAGLKVDDVVIRVNRQNVSRSTALSVVKLVKNSGSMVSLEVRRSTPLMSAESSPEQTYEKRSYHDDSDNDSGHSTDIHETSACDFFTLPPDSFVQSERRRQSAVLRLLNAEEDFVNLMHCGMQQYSRPLRHCILTPTQHAALFQNIEKLVTISEYHSRQLADIMTSLMSDDTDTSAISDNFPTSIDAVAMIYLSKLGMLSQAYDMYARGLTGAQYVLAYLQKSVDFAAFTKNLPQREKSLTISAFIHRPLHHLKSIQECLRDIYTNTPVICQERAQFCQLVEGLQETINRITDYGCVPTLHLSAMEVSINKKSRSRSSQMSGSSTSSTSSLTSSSSGVGSSVSSLTGSTAPYKSIETIV